MSYRKVVRVQMKREDADGKVMYSNLDPLSINMPEAGYLELQMYDGDQFLGTTCQYLEVCETPNLSSFTIAPTN